MANCSRQIVLWEDLCMGNEVFKGRVLAYGVRIQKLDP